MVSSLYLVCQTQNELSLEIFGTFSEYMNIIHFYLPSKCNKGLSPIVKVSVLKDCFRL